MIEIITCYFLQLRHDMIDQKEGETDLTIKTDYDNRVSLLTIPIARELSSRI